MKKTLIVLLALFLLLGVIHFSSGTGTVQASANGPTVTSIQGDSEFSVVVKEPAALTSGTAESNGLVVPAGFPLGEKQFSGSVVIVSGLSYGSARISFVFSGYGYGWTGSIYQWLNGKWTPLSTTITPGAEGAPAHASAAITSDGTYALLIGYTDPVSRMKPCTDYTVDGTAISENQVLRNIIFMGMALRPGLPVGTRLTYQVVNVSPARSLFGTLSGELIASFLINEGTPGEVVILNADPGNSWTYSADNVPTSFTIRVFIDNCYVDKTYFLMPPNQTPMGPF